MPSISGDFQFMGPLITGAAGDTSNGPCRLSFGEANCTLTPDQFREAAARLAEGRADHSSREAWRKQVEVLLAETEGSR